VVAGVEVVDAHRLVEEEVVKPRREGRRGEKKRYENESDPHDATG
jgi:hypothetical protein